MTPHCEVIEECMSMTTLKAPFPYFGGKSRAAPLIWERLGDVPNFVDPFFGSGAVLFNRPHPPGIETVNDADGFICNVFRALAADPEVVAHHCDYPPNECDMTASHTWLVGQREVFTSRLMGDPDYYDAQVAGRWLYGIACWIGGGWCSGNGPWQSVDGQLLHLGNAGQGVYRRLLHLGNAGQGVHRKILHLGSAGRGVHRQLLHLGDAGRGVHRKILHLGSAGQGVHRPHLDGLLAYFQALQARLRYVRVCCGDWQRVMGPSVTEKLGLTGIVLDPPYSQEEDRDLDLYAVEDSQVAHAVRDWCLAHGANPLLRIALCGYGTIHDALLSHGWSKVGWKANGGMGNQGHGRGRRNAFREMVWFNQSCLDPQAPQQSSLFPPEALCPPPP